MKVKDIAVARKRRKGAPRQITKDGAYWIVIEAQIDHRGGDGIGQSASNIYDYYRVRHYRDGSVRAYCESESWHQNSGHGTERTRCDNTLECETIEDLITLIKRVPLNREFPTDFYSVYWDKRLEQALPELPVALAAPDEE